MSPFPPSYKYDALGRKTVENPGTVNDLYYSDKWQVLEERSGGVSTATIQYVWSPVYVDALIERDRSTHNNGTMDERLYVQQDANWNVTALVSTSGSVVERYVYDPYGKPTFLNATWGSLSGSAYTWIYLHQGGRYDGTSLLYNFRQRHYSPTLGRWLQVDPSGFTGGSTNLYLGLGDEPTTLLDPRGLWPDGGGGGGQGGAPPPGMTRPISPLPFSPGLLGPGNGSNGGQGGAPPDWDQSRKRWADSKARTEESERIRNYLRGQLRVQGWNDEEIDRYFGTKKPRQLSVGRDKRTAYEKADDAFRALRKAEMIYEISPTEENKKRLQEAAKRARSHMPHEHPPHDAHREPKDEEDAITKEEWNHLVNRLGNSPLVGWLHGSPGASTSPNYDPHDPKLDERYRRLNPVKPR